MATENKNKGQEEKITALYARLSDDDPENEKKGIGSDKESNSIQNQRTILYDYARSHGHLHPQFFYDDGVSGTTFERPGFKEMEELVEAGKVSTIIVKDLSRFGRNYLEVGNYLEVVYSAAGHTDHQYLLFFVFHVEKTPYSARQTEITAIMLSSSVIPAYILTICVSEYPFFSK